MARISIQRYGGNIAGAGCSSADIDDLKIVCDTSNGKQEVLVYVNGEAIFGKDFSRKAKMIYNNVAVYED